MKTKLHLSDFLIVRFQTDQVAAAMQTARLDRIQLAQMSGGIAEEEIIDAQDVFTAFLRVVSKARGRLKSESGGIGLGGEPISFQLSGNIVDVSSEQERILLQIDQSK